MAGKQHTEEYKVFKEHYAKLKSILPAKNFSQHFVSADVISFDDEDEIGSATTASARAGILLQKIARSLEGGSTFGFYTMLHVMEERGNIANKALATKMLAQLSSQQEGPAVHRPPPPPAVSEPAQNKPQDVTVSHPPASWSPATRGMSTVSSPNTAPLPAPLHAGSNSSVGQDHTDLKAPNMKWMHKIVIPRIAFCWSKVADFLEYPIHKKQEIELRQHYDPTRCCTELLEHWLSTSAESRSWSGLLSVLKDIKELTSVCESIEKELLQNGLIS